MRAQDIGEQVVVAVPVATVVEGYDEQVRPLERLEHGLGVADAGDRIAERAAQPFEDRGVEQEGADGLGLADEHLLDEVVDDVPIVAREAGDEPGGVLASLQREGRELQGGDPPLGASLESGDVRGREIQSDDVVQVRRHLVEGEPEVGRAYLDELAARPQSGQRQGRVGAGADHQVHLRGKVRQEEPDVRRDRVAVGQVVVVEHQVDAHGHGSQLVEERGEDRLHRRLRRLEDRQDPRTHAGDRVVQGGRHVGPEGRGLSLRLLQRHPRHPATRGRRGVDPGGEQRRLPESRGPGDQRQPRLRADVQPLGQSWARHQATSCLRDVELGPDQRARHVDSPRAAATDRPDSRARSGGVSVGAWLRLRA